MGKLGDKLGRFDDDSVIYRAHDPEQKVSWGRAAVACVAATLVVGGLGVLGRVTDTEELVMAVTLAAPVVFLVVYVIWRRRRNERLTGSPTRWPSP